MLQEYSISDLFPVPSRLASSHVYPFQKMDLPHLVWPHKYDFYSIVWFTEGSGFYVIDFIEYIILPNRMFLISPEQIQNWIYNCNVKGYILIFDKIAAAQLDIGFLSPYVDIDADDVTLFKLVIENSICKKPDSNIETDLLYFYSLIADKIKNRKVDTSGINTLFREFKNLILINDLKIQSMDQYADTLHISLTSLNDICKNFSGTSAKQFLLEIKIGEAKRLLIYSRLNVSDIAYQLGFEDSSYFARIFKKKTTLAPSAFLEKYRK